MNQQGQVAIIILLFLLVALTIGLAVTQRSLTNITTSSQTEQSSRAFSAAEAGIQRSIQAVPVVVNGVNPPISAVTESELGNSSNALVSVVNNLPRPGEALEYPSIGRDTIAQFWLADPLNQNADWDKSNAGTLANHRYAYNGGNLAVFWGNIPIPTPVPAIEINLVVQTGSGPAAVFSSHRYFFDGQNRGNNFTVLPPGACTASPLPVHTSSSVDSSTSDRYFYCSTTIPIPAAEVPVVIRARILYSNGKEPIAVGPTGGCSGNCDLPPQAAIYTARGFSGQSQKTLQVFRQPFYLSPLLDFALFSAGPITK
jgi:hypothetical protein